MENIVTWNEKQNHAAVSLMKAAGMNQSFRGATDGMFHSPGDSLGRAVPSGTSGMVPAFPC